MFLLDICIENCYKNIYEKCFEEEKNGNFNKTIELCNKLLSINTIVCKGVCKLTKFQIIKLKYLKIISTFHMNDYKNVSYLIDNFYQEYYKELEYILQNKYKTNEKINNRQPPSILLRNNKKILSDDIDENNINDKYIYGVILFSILFFYLYEPMRNYNKLYFYLNIFKTWNKDLKNILRKDFFGYYSYATILNKLPMIKTNSNNNTYIYLLGESHILPLSWQYINIKNMKYQLKPYFVPGLKAYHFSINANIYNTHEASILHNQLKMIPQNSIVLLICGEIDCRSNEGILDAVKKKKYSTVINCIESTINSYLESLEKIAKFKKLHIFICPVRPPFLKKSKINKCMNYEMAHKSQKLKKEINIITPSPIQLVYNNALLIRDFNYELKKMVIKKYNKKNNNVWSLNYLNNVYNNLCGSFYEHRGEDIGKGDASLYLLSDVYTLEGLHLNTKIVEIIEKSFNLSKLDK